MAVVYQHKKKGTNQIFYIGMGHEDRPYSTTGRNIHWKRTVSKYGYEIEILQSDLSYEDAKSWEKYLIDIVGRRDLKKGNLVNMTDGGEGVRGLVKSIEERQELSRIKKEYYKTNKHRYLGVFGSDHPSYGYRHTEKALEHLREKKLGENNPMYNKKGALCPNSKKVIDTSTGLVYDSCTIAAEATGIRRKTLSRKLAGSRKNDTSLRYL